MSVDTTSNRQSQINRKVNKEIVDIKNLFISDNREIPNQIRIQYKPLSGTNKIKFLYDKFHNDDLLIGDHEVFDEWFNQIQNGSGDLFQVVEYLWYWIEKIFKYISYLPK